MREHTHGRVRFELSKAKDRGKDKKNSTVHNITKHYSEKEGESYGGKDGWIYLFVFRNAVSINNHLERHGELVGLDESGSNEN